MKFTRWIEAKGANGRQREPPRHRGKQSRTACARSGGPLPPRRNGNRSRAVPGRSGLLFRRNCCRSAWCGVAPRGRGSRRTVPAVPVLPRRRALGRPGRPTAEREPRNDRDLSRSRTRNARKVPAESYSSRLPPSARRYAARNQIIPWHAHYLSALYWIYPIVPISVAFLTGSAISFSLANVPAKL